MANTDVQVLIAGAGPTGLTLACELARRGLRPRVVDASDGPSTKSKALALHARTLDVLRDSGTAMRLVEAGLTCRRVNIYTGTGPLGSIDFDGLKSAFPFVLLLPQSETERVLAARLNEMGIEVEWRTKLTGVETRPESVIATLESAHGESQAEAQWLGGCDGAHSVTRHALGMTFEGSAYGEQFALADVQIKMDRAPDQLHLFLLHEGVTAFFPYRGGRWRLIADVTRCGMGEDLTFEDIQRVIAQRVPGAELSDPVWTAVFRIHRRKAEAFRRGRAFLLGDAAHIHSPAGGQGMNTGIQDAHNLGWKLALACKSKASAALMDSYNAEREPVARAVLRQTDAMTKVATTSMAPFAGARDLLLHAALAVGFVQEQAVLTLSQESVKYARSSVIQGDGKFQGARAGEYVGGVEGRDPERHTLYVRPAETAELGGAEVARAAMPERAGAEVAVVRPDGYLGYAAERFDRGALQSYFVAVFGTGDSARPASR